MLRWTTTGRSAPGIFLTKGIRQIGTILHAKRVVSDER